MYLSDSVMVREVFFGVSPTGIRIIDPSTLEPELVFDKLQVYNMKYGQYLGNTALKIKYYLDYGTGTTKLKKLKLHVLPVTAQDILRWYDYCSNFGEEADSLSKLPVFRPDESKNKKSNLQRGNSVANLPAKPKLMKETTNLSKSSSSNATSKYSSSLKEPMTPLLSSSNKENQPPPGHVARNRKCSSSKPPLTKSKSALDSFGRI